MGVIIISRITSIPRHRKCLASERGEGRRSRRDAPSAQLPCPQRCCAPVYIGQSAGHHLHRCFCCCRNNHSANGVCVWLMIKSPYQFLQPEQAPVQFLRKTWRIKHHHSPARLLKRDLNGRKLGRCVVLRLVNCNKCANLEVLRQGNDHPGMC